MSVPRALVVAPHCTDPGSGWFSPGRLAKLTQVMAILERSGYVTAVLNTCPVRVREAFKAEVQLSRRPRALPRLAAFLVAPLGNLVPPCPQLIWVYNSRVPETIVVWRLRRLYPRALLVVELEDLPAARKSNASWRGWLDWLSTGWLVRHASLITCVSEAAGWALQRHLAISADRMRILLPPLLDDDFVDAAEQRGMPPFSRRLIRVFYAGGYDPEKGVDDLLWAFAALPASRFRLHLVGPATQGIRQRALGMPHVYVHGCIPQKWLNRCYQLADVVVNPHRSILNGSHVFPFKAIEQAACGALPLMSTHLGADSLGLPPPCLFRSREELHAALAQAPEIWNRHHEALAARAAKLRQSHGVAAFAETFAAWLQSVQNPNHR